MTSFVCGEIPHGIRIIYYIIYWVTGSCIFFRGLRLKNKTVYTDTDGGGKEKKSKKKIKINNNNNKNPYGHLNGRVILLYIIR